MSYDISLNDPATGEALELDAPHHMRGGTYAVGGTNEAYLNVTWNYARHYYRVFEPAPLRAGVDPYHAKDEGKVGGIRAIYGLTGAESILVLQRAIGLLGDDVHRDYWEPTEGNAKRALTQLLALAQMRPDGVWNGD